MPTAVPSVHRLVLSKKMSRIILHAFDGLLERLVGGVNVEALLVLAVAAQQFSGHLVELPVLDAAGLGAAALHGAHGRDVLLPLLLLLGRLAGLLGVVGLAARLLVLLDLLGDEHGLLLWLVLGLLLVLDLRVGGVTSESEEKRSSSLGSSSPKSASFFFLKTLFSTLTNFSNRMGGRSGFLFLRQQGFWSSMMTCAPVRAQTSISRPLYWLLAAKGLPVMMRRLREMKLRAQIRLCWFSTLLCEKSSSTSVEKLPAASFSVWIPRILFRATEITSTLGRVASAAQKLAALQSERKLFPSRLRRLRRRKFSRESGSSLRSLKERSRAMRQGMSVSWGMQVQARKLKERLSSWRHSKPPCSSATSRIWLWAMLIFSTAGSLRRRSRGMQFSEQLSSMRLEKYSRWSSLRSTMRRQEMLAVTTSLGCSNRSIFSSMSPSTDFSRMASSPGMRMRLILQGFLECSFFFFFLPARGSSIGFSTTFPTGSGFWSIAVNWLYISSYTPTFPPHTTPITHHTAQNATPLPLSSQPCRRAFALCAGVAFY